MSRTGEELDVLTASGEPFAIVVEEVRGVPVRNFAGRPHHVSGIAVRAASHEGVFVVRGGRRLTFAETFNRAGRLAGALRRLVVKTVLWGTAPSAANGDSAL